MERRTPDAAVAAAMDRVLAAEGEAAEAIAAAEREAEATIEAASGRRRRILEVARRRASRLHMHAQEQLQREIQRLDGLALSDETDVDALRERASAALDRLVARLTSDDHEPN